ncbi:two-component system response regulator [Nostoc sp. MBR 210]|nr:two-component system response regulator [Nostoc sp. MBR 210]
MSTVLVVEDSYTQRHLLEELLKANAFDVKTACDGIEALEQIQCDRPDIIILDIVMPRLNGYEVCRKIKRNPETQALPVIFCSSNAGMSDHYWGLKMGAIAYISKPFQPQELIQTINQVLNPS